METAGRSLFTSDQCFDRGIFYFWLRRNSPQAHSLVSRHLSASPLALNRSRTPPTRHFTDRVLASCQNTEACCSTLRSTIACRLGRSQLLERLDGVLGRLARRGRVHARHEAPVDDGEGVPRARRLDVGRALGRRALLDRRLAPRLRATGSQRMGQPACTPGCGGAESGGRTVISSRKASSTSPLVVKPVTFLPSISGLPLDSLRLTKMAPPCSVGAKEKSAARG